MYCGWSGAAIELASGGGDRLKREIRQEKGTKRVEINRAGTPVPPSESGWAHLETEIGPALPGAARAGEAARFRDRLSESKQSGTMSIVSFILLPKIFEKISHGASLTIPVMWPRLKMY